MQFSRVTQETKSQISRQALRQPDLRLMPHARHDLAVVNGYALAPNFHPGRLDSDSQTPPPIKVSPESRPSSLARAGFMSQMRPKPASMAQPQSPKIASSTETVHMSASWGAAGRVGSTNCGRNAVKNAIVYGFDSATRNPRQK